MFDFLKRVGFFYWLQYGIVRAHFAVWHRLTVNGQENIPLEGGIILAANHLSHLDSPSIGCCIPRRSRYVADTGMFRKFFLNWYLPRTGGIPIDRSSSGGEKMINTAVDVLKKGDLLILYPEGTRSRTGYPSRARTGMIVLACKAGVPIVPCRISGTFKCWPYSVKWPRPGPIQVSFGKPIQWNPDDLDLKNRGDLETKSTQVMAAIQSLPGWIPKTASPRPELV
jgi:1-acyl-sn-glycerol-3-phosphate acyltransferase